MLAPPCGCGFSMELGAKVKTMKISSGLSVGVFAKVCTAKVSHSTVFVVWKTHQTITIQQILVKNMCSTSVRFASSDPNYGSKADTALVAHFGSHIGLMSS